MRPTTLTRRAPLALLAAYNLMSRYPVDAQKVYVGGFSGGARIALRLALAYPDLFHGALLNAGSDPLGMPGRPHRRSPQLLQQFQESTRLVYVTGEHDTHISLWTPTVCSSLHQLVRLQRSTHKSPSERPHAVADAGGASAGR